MRHMKDRQSDHRDPAARVLQRREKLFRRAGTCTWQICGLNFTCRVLRLVWLKIRVVRPLKATSNWSVLITFPQLSRKKVACEQHDKRTISYAERIVFVKLLLVLVCKPVSTIASECVHSLLRMRPRDFNPLIDCRSCYSENFSHQSTFQKERERNLQRECHN